MNTPELEQETIININEVEKTATIYSNNRRLINKLLRSCKKYPEYFKLESEDGANMTFVVPKKHISIKMPREREESLDEKM
jgi:hypothetical protein